MNEGWPHAASPFHTGESAVQERLGVRDGVDPVARRMVRDYMPEQHRTFFAGLPFLLLGAVDRAGQPWATLMTGQPGFVSSPDDRVLDIVGRPLSGDPVLHDLAPGDDIGVLGIELGTRRRNRATGRIIRADQEGIGIAIDQSFGNCPQYIQTRSVDALPIGRPQDHAPPVESLTHFDAAVLALLEKSDTFFIATAFRDRSDAAFQGADVSHRGGMPGFIRIEGDGGFSFPDYPGNRHFNTLGNIHLNPRAGFLFIDFDAGDLVYMTGDAEIVWDGGEDVAYAGAGRRVRFRAREIRRVSHAADLRFTFGDYSPSHRRLHLRQE